MKNFKPFVRFSYEKQGLTGDKKGFPHETISTK